jgi:hypothetical protein
MRVDAVGRVEAPSANAVRLGARIVPAAAHVASSMMQLLGSLVAPVVPLPRQSVQGSCRSQAGPHGTAQAAVLAQPARAVLLHHWPSCPPVIGQVGPRQAAVVASQAAVAGLGPSPVGIGLAADRPCGQLWQAAVVRHVLVRPVRCRPPNAQPVVLWQRALRPVVAGGGGAVAVSSSSSAAGQAFPGCILQHMHACTTYACMHSPAGLVPT